MFDNHCENGHERIGYDDTESGKCPLCAAMALLVEAGYVTDDIVGDSDPVRVWADQAQG